MTNWAKREYAITDSNEIPLVAGVRNKCLTRKVPKYFQGGYEQQSSGRKGKFADVTNFYLIDFHDGT